MTTRNPHAVTREFERAIAEYTGAPEAVAVNSCTMALLLACAWWYRCYNGHDSGPTFEIPRRTYVGVPMSILHAGGAVKFREENWLGFYQLKPYPIWDSARWFTTGVWGFITDPLRRGLTGDTDMVCVSFHASKTLGIEQGGAILHGGDPELDAWLRRARFDGRTEGVAPKDDLFLHRGWHCYMNPSTAAQGLLRLHSLPKYNEPLPNDDYPDLSKFDLFN